MSKNITLSALLICSTILISNAQTTLHLRAYESDYLDSYSPTQNQSTTQEMDAIAWTAGGSFVSRSVFNFDLSHIPAHSVISSAYLSLWGDTNTSNGEGDSHLSGSNAWSIQRVSSSYNNSTVTWNTQPTTDTTDEVRMPQSTSIYEIFDSIHVTKLMQAIVDSGHNYGLLIRLDTETIYRSMVFCSSQYPDTSERPLLNITYTAPAGINEVSNKPIASLYPNPVNDFINVSYSGKNSNVVYYRLYDITGKQIGDVNSIFGRGNNITTTINTSNLTSGMYLLKLIDGSTITNYKFIKE